MVKTGHKGTQGNLRPTHPQPTAEPGNMFPSALSDDPPPVTPFNVLYEGGNVRLRYYRAFGAPHTTPLILIYALLKRPFILDLHPGRSVVEYLTRQGFAVYLTDWVPPLYEDRRRGFEAYVNHDLAEVVRVVQQRTGVPHVSLLGYSLGGLLGIVYTALHPTAVKNLLTVMPPLDFGSGVVPWYTSVYSLQPTILHRILAFYGNCPAWLIRAAITVMVPSPLSLPLFLRQDLREPALAQAAMPGLAVWRDTFTFDTGCDTHNDQQDYKELLAALRRWLNSDVPLAGQLCRELVEDILNKNLLVQGRFQVSDQTVNLRHITCPVLNVVAEYDQVVPPNASLPLIDLVGSSDKQNILCTTGHMGLAVSTVAHRRLWPRVGRWLTEHDGPR